MKPIQAIRIKQPIGEFFIASISSKLINQVSYSRTAGFEQSELSGNQRDLRDNRVEEIRNYINTSNASFPNSIILNANYYENDELEVDDDKRWSVRHIDGDIYELDIPDENLKLCSVIDGQHRVNGFKQSGVDMMLPCSIFIDLPPSMQAYVFATINFNQHKVDKSLAYQLFGYQLDESEKMMWSPDILAVKLSRSLNAEGAFKGRIKLIKEAPKKKKVDKDEEASPPNQDQNDIASNPDWSISSAAFIEGVVSLISGNAKADKYIVNKKKVVGYGSRSDLEDNKKYPLRKYYIDGNDSAIKTILERYFEAIEKYLWEGKEHDNIVFRTVGISAQFSFLKELILSNSVKLDKKLSFLELLVPLSEVNFQSEYFSARTATKRRVVDTLKLRIGLLKQEDIEEGEYKEAILQAANMK